MILAIVGTRKLPPKMAEYAGLIIAHEVTSGRWESFCTGAALTGSRIVPTSGIDAMAKRICDQYGARCALLVAEVPEWDHPQGFKARNKLLAATCDELLCLRYGESASYGSGWTAEHCLTLGKPVHRVEFR
jgi:hypothetical protein